MKKQQHDAYERARAATVMTRRALAELEDLERHHIVERPVVERLREFYRARGALAESRARAAVGSARLSEQAAEAIARLLEAERVGLRVAQHAEIIDGTVAAELSAELAERLAILEEAIGCGEAQLEQAIDQILAAPTDSDSD